MSRFRAGKCLLINVLLYIAQMAQHLGVRFLPVTGRNSGGDRFVEAGIHRLALEAMRMFTQAAPSGPMITPCGAAPGPNAIKSDFPVLGSRRPSLPADCAVNHTAPSGAG